MEEKKQKLPYEKAEMQVIELQSEGLIVSSDEHCAQLEGCDKEG